MQAVQETLAGVQPGQKKSQRKSDIHAQDRLFYGLLRMSARLVIVLLLGIALKLLQVAWPALSAFGLAFFVNADWDPVGESFGSLAMAYGTVVSSLLALLLATPIGIAVALALSEILPKRVAWILNFLVEMLAAIPSVVYGLWGVFVLVPWLRTTVEPFFIRNFGFLPIFKGPPFGVGMFAAGVILAIMIIPTISSICKETFKAIPASHREAALALGATRWEMMRIAVLKSSRMGIIAGTMLGLGRALGETMAVTMVIGNRPDISASLFAPAQTLASLIANEYAEAGSDLHLSALAGVGLTLFVISLFSNGLARFLSRYAGRSFSEGGH